MLEFFLPIKYSEVRTYLERVADRMQKTVERTSGKGFGAFYKGGGGGTVTSRVANFPSGTYMLISEGLSTRPAKYRTVIDND